MEIWSLRWRCPWCNGYRHRLWTRRYEINSWTRLKAFHIGMNPIILPPAMLYLSYAPPTYEYGTRPNRLLKIIAILKRKNSRAEIVGQTRIYSLGEATSLKPVKLRLKKLTLCHILPERRGWVNRIWSLRWNKILLAVNSSLYNRYSS